MSQNFLFKTYLLHVFIFFSIPLLLAQEPSCGVLVHAGPDQYLCRPGQVLQLQGQVEGEYLSAFWTPAAGFFNPDILQTAWQGQAPAVLQLNVQSLTGPELVANGDFDLGNTGFSSNYTIGLNGPYGPVSNPGTYGITTAANLVHSQFAPCTDRSGGGRMMVVNGATTPGNVWCQTIAVSPETDYALSAWFAVVANQNPSAIIFTVNGVAQGQNFTLPNLVCSWSRFFRVWNSGQNTSAQICIRNVSTASAGNDFCLDDISVRQICHSRDTVSIIPAVLRATFEIPDAFCENSAPIILDSLLSPTTTPGGNWTVNGEPAIQFHPENFEPGIQELRYSVVQGNCVEASMQTVRIVALPSAGVQSAPLELCTGEIQQIALFELLNGADSGGSWTETSLVPTPLGAFEAYTGQLSIQNLSTGSYRFMYRTAAAPPCQDDSAEIIVHVRPRPKADAGTDQTLDCSMRQVSIGGNQTESGPGLLYRWSSPDGGIIFQQGLPFTDTDQAGTYILEVSRGEFGCADTDTVVVRSVISEPVFLLNTQAISCAGQSDGQITITEILNATPPFLFSINQAPMSPTMQFSGLNAGNYQISMEDSNGCTAIQQTYLPEPPPITAEIGTALNGQLPRVHLGDSTTLYLITNLSDGAIQSITWMPDLMDCGDCTRLRIAPVDITTYEVIITDTSGCTAHAALTLWVDQTLRLFVPNAFTPDGDGINDILIPFGGPEVLQIISFTVADRWGNLLFRQRHFPPSDPEWGWDGKAREKPMEPGVYLFVLEALLVSGKTVLISGEVSLLR